MSLVNRAAVPREGEALDLARLEDFLHSALPGLSGPLTVLQFPSGYSNLTYLLEAGGRRLVLRRPPFGTKARTAHDMGREHRVLSALHSVYPYAPRPLLHCTDETVIGAEFYLIEHIEGLIVRRDYPPGLALPPDEVRAQFLAMFDALAELHAVDFEAAGLGALGRPEGYTARQVAGWSKRYAAARTPDAPDFEAAMQWLHDKQPPEAGRAALIHNDFKMDNVVWNAEDPLRLVGVLDWEMCTVGDPLMDLGGTLGYWVEAGDSEFFRAARMMPSTAPGAPSRREIAARYAARTGLAVEPFDFYFVFGLFRLAVIGQQLYYRYYHGQTRDARFARCLDWNHALDRMCTHVIARSEL